jgi:hypothetical protein
LILCLIFKNEVMMKKLSIFLYFCLCFQWMNAQTIGMLQNTEGSFNGYTMISSLNSTTTYLVDNCGNQVNNWTSEFPPGAAAYLLEDGSLLRAARINNSFNAGGSGGRLERFDWEGNLTWSFNYSNEEYQLHHDFEVLENGNILLLAWELHSEEEAMSLGRTVEGNVWSEQVIEIEPVGNDAVNIVWEWRLWDHLIQNTDSSLDNYGEISEHPELWNLNYVLEAATTDWLHFNSINYNTALDQILLSSKHFSEVYIIDHSTTTEESATHNGGNSNKGGDILYRWGNPQAYNRGDENDQKFFGQHDAHWISEDLVDEGKIMIFNNGSNRPIGSFSSVDIITTPVDANGIYPIDNDAAFAPANLSWSYGDGTTDFFSAFLSGAQRQTNGNTLICEGRDGYIFEIDSENQIVWEYINPISALGPLNQGDTALGHSLFRAYRYAVDYAAFEGRDLTPGLPIELNPINQNCTIFEEGMVTNSNILSEEVFLKQNPINNQVIIKNTLNSFINVSVNDINGRLITQVSSTQQQLIIDAKNWQKGLYIIHVSEKENNRFSNFKVMKF